MGVSLVPGPPTQVKTPALTPRAMAKRHDSRYFRDPNLMAPPQKNPMLLRSQHPPCSDPLCHHGSRMLARFHLSQPSTSKCGRELTRQEEHFEEPPK